MLWKLIYNLILFPLFFFTIIILSIFSKKIRTGFYGRLRSKKIINDFVSKSENKDIYWFHAASLGEYEQIKPILSGLKEIEPESQFVLSFFSPSGFNFVDDKEVDCKIYLPFDFKWIVKRYLKKLNPRKIILAGYDVWPNLIWVAKELNIHSVLFAARFSNKSSKMYPLVKIFYRNIYNSFNAIYTISKNDSEQLKLIIGEKNNPILRTLGNPRYDQVKLKSDKFTQERTKSVRQRPKRLILGSMHQEDEKRLGSFLIKLINDIEDLSLIWAPHTPSKKSISRIKVFLNKNNITYQNLGEDIIEKINAKVIIVDSVGKLAQLYWHGQVAYIGGGFSSGVHNVMEPAIARLPIFFGPKYSNFHEAEELIEKGGGFSIQTGDELYIQVSSLLNDKNKFISSSFSATNVVHDNLGSSTRIVRRLIHD